MSFTSSRGKDNPQRKRLVEIAETTIQALDHGSYLLEDVGEIFLTEAITRCVENTRLYHADSSLAGWASASRSSLNIIGQPVHVAASPISPSDTDSSFETGTRESKEKSAEIIILQISTLAGARLLATTTSRGSDSGAYEELETTREDNKIGILNFASAKNRGGGFLNGASAQEESLVRSSTLYPSLKSATAEPFYDLHRHDPQAGYYSHSMIYSPNVLLLRDDDGTWQRPIVVDVLTSPAVNAGVVRQSIVARLQANTATTAKIERVMHERAARLLYAFERARVRHLVLGAWGCGVFKNDVRAVARMWAALLAVPGARFRRSFERVVFAVLGEEMHRAFEDAFNERVDEGHGVHGTLFAVPTLPSQ